MQTTRGGKELNGPLSFSGELPRLDDRAVADTVADIDAAVLAATTDRSRFTDVWHGTFSLPYWYFLAQRDAEGTDSLYTGTVQGEPYLFAFTTGARLREFAIGELGVYAESQQVPAAVTTPREFVDVAERYAATGVRGIAFDHRVNGHYTGLDNLAALWQHCFDTGGSSVTGG